jgi:DNA-binding transcriptional regulator YdaS (Cro superfamily)
MFKPDTPPPPKKSGFPDSAKGPLEKDVMEAVKRKGKPSRSPQIEKAKRDLLEVIKKKNLNPQAIIHAGQLAEAAMKNPREMYQIALENAIKEGLIRPEDVQPGVVDWKVIATGVAAGNMVKEMMEEGML